MLNKKSQTADGLTWVVATLIIVVMLIVFISITNLLVKTKDIEKFVKGIFSGDDDEQVSKIDVKTTLAFEKNSANREFVEGWVKNEPQG